MSETPGANRARKVGKPKAPASAPRAASRKRPKSEDQTDSPPNKRFNVAHTWGEQFMLFRRKDGERTWARCSHDAAHQADSFVHRYDRETGFRGDQEEGEGRESTTSAAARLGRALGIGKKLSHPQRVLFWALFERYALAK